MCIRVEWAREFFTKFGRKQIPTHRVCRQLGNSTTQCALARRWEKDAMGGKTKGDSTKRKEEEIGKREGVLVRERTNMSHVRQQERERERER